MRRARSTEHARKASLAAQGVLAGSLAVSAALGLFVFSSDAGGVGLAASVVVALTLAVVILVRPMVGVYVTLFAVLVVEQYTFSEAFSPVTMKIPLYSYVFGKNVQITPLDLLLGVTALGAMVEWLRAPKAARSIRLPRKGFAVGFAVLGVALLVAEAVGLSRAHCAGYSPVGAAMTDCNFRFKVSVYEMRSFVYAALGSFLAFRYIATIARARALLVVVALAESVKIVQTFDRLFVGVTRHYTEDKMRALTAHEDAMFFGLVLAMVLAAVAFRGKGVLERALVCLGPAALAAFAIANRRTAYVGLALFLIAYFVALPRVRAQRLALMLAPLVVLFAIYTPLFWHRPGTIGRPARAVNAIIAPSGIDLRANEYRAIESYDLTSGLKDHLALGLGLGHVYPQPIPLPALESEYQPFIAHQELLWFWLAAGTGGFIALWVWFGGLFVTAAAALRRTLDPTVAMVATIAMAAVVMELAAASVDLQLTFYRNMTVVGVLVGAAARCAHLDAQPDTPVPMRSPQRHRARRPHRERRVPAWKTSSSA